MKIPSAPSYKFVFLFGAVYNLLIEKCIWATIFCMMCWLLILVTERVIEHKREVRIK